MNTSSEIQYLLCQWQLERADQFTRSEHRQTLMPERETGRPEVFMYRLLAASEKTMKNTQGTSYQKGQSVYELTPNKLEKSVTYSPCLKGRGFYRQTRLRRRTCS